MPKDLDIQFMRELSDFLKKYGAFDSRNLQHDFPFDDISPQVLTIIAEAFITSIEGDGKYCDYPEWKVLRAWGKTTINPGETVQVHINGKALADGPTEYDFYWLCGENITTTLGVIHGRFIANCQKPIDGSVPTIIEHDQVLGVIKKKQPLDDDDLPKTYTFYRKN